MMWRWFWVGSVFCWALWRRLQVLPFSFVYMLHVACVPTENAACHVLWPQPVCAVWDEQKRGGLRSLCCVTQGLLSWFHDALINSTESTCTVWWRLGTGCSFVANKPSGHRVYRVLFVHVCSKLASDVISKVPCPVAKAPLLAEYSFFGQMGVEQAVLSAIENGIRFLDSDSDLTCDAISKL